MILQRYFNITKKIFLRNSDHSDLLKKLDGCGLIKKVLYHKFFSKQYKAISE